MCPQAGGDGRDVCRRTGLPADERELWWVDPEAAVVSELAAAQNIRQGLALAQTHRGVALRDRLPRVAALFEAGLINDLLVRTIVWRTYLINDTEAIAKVDADLADQVLAWGALSVKKTEQAIDALVEEGFTSLWARLYAPDAAVLERPVPKISNAASPPNADSTTSSSPNATNHRPFEAPSEPSGVPMRWQNMALRFFLIYALVELAVVVALASTIGFGWTVLLLLGTFVIGVALAGSQVRRHVRRCSPG